MKKILTILFGIALLSCERENTEFKPIDSVEEHFVSFGKISKIVNNKSFKRSLSKFTTDELQKKSLDESVSITNYKEYKDKNNVAAFYFAELSNNQLILFAADNRSHPVMAIMDNENKASIEDIPSEFSYWLDEEINAIEFARDNNLAQSTEIAKEWTTYQRVPPDDPTVCSNEYYENKTPLLTTNWGQGVGYNNYTPNKNCSNYSNGNTPTGCVATAMAQVMRFFQYPTSYNWNSMPNNGGSNATSLLMKDVGTNVDMNYGCDGSGTKATNASGAFIKFGYSQAFNADYNYNTVVSEISQNKPVIISGGEKKYWAIFPYYADGHAWVADGYIRGFSCSYDENGNVNGGYGYLMLHLNWGWNGSFNGYFGFNNFSVNNDSYNYKNKMVYGIRK